MIQWLLTVQLKVPRKWNLFLFSFKIYLVKYAIPKLQTSGVKSNDFTSLQSWAILPSKMVFESRGQNTTWHQPLTSLWCQNRSHNVQLVPQIRKVTKTQHSRRVYECISFPQILLFERNGSSLSEDTDTTSRIRHQNTLRYTRHILKSRPISDEPGDKNEIMLKKGRDTNEGHRFDRTIEFHFRWCICDLSAATKLARTN